MSAHPDPKLLDLIDRDQIVGHGVDIARGINPWSDFRSIVKLYQLFRRERPDIVQVSTPKAAAIGSLAAWAARVPVRLFQVRGLFSEGKTGMRARFARWIDVVPARFCTHLTANSSSMLTTAEQQGVVRPGFGVVLANGTSNGVDVDRFDPRIVRAARFTNTGDDVENAACVVFGFVGRLTVDKGLHDLAMAWQRVRDECRNTKLLIVGPWEQRNGVDQRYRNQLMDDPRVTIVGPQKSVEPYYKAMDVLVFPSHREGFPNAPLEAASMEIPVIAAEVSGTSEAVNDGQTGCLVPVRDVDALARAMIRYARDPSLRAEQGRAGRVRVQNLFSPLAVLASIPSVLLEVAGRSQSIDVRLRGAR